MANDVGGGRSLDPLIARMADRNKAKEILHRIKNIMLEKAIFFFSVSMSASLLKTTVHSLAIPPVDENTSGVN